MNRQLKIALIAHDRRKSDMLDWAEFNRLYLRRHKLVCTGTTGLLINNLLNDIETQEFTDITCVNSGPLGGDAEIAAMIVRGEVDLCVFFIDDLDSQPHEADIQMLLRQCRVHNIPVACNRYTADLIITSNLWDNENYKPTKPTYKKYNRE
jgi:methylglyoxal synthase